MDTTLVDFNDMKWERGDISFIFNGEAKPNQSLTVLDNKLKVFQRIRYEVSTCLTIPFTIKIYNCMVVADRCSGCEIQVLIIHEE